MKSYLVAFILACCTSFAIGTNAASTEWEKVGDEELYREFGMASAEKWSNVRTILMAPARNLAPTGPARLLLDDDFEDGGCPAWQLEPNWDIYTDSGNKVLRGRGHHWASIGGPNWHVSRFQMKVKLIQGGLHINFGVNDDGRYFLGFNDEGLYLSRQFDEWRQFADLVSVSKRFDPGKWHSIELYLGDLGNGAKIKVHIDGELLLTSQDDYYSVGSIAYESHDNSVVYVDDVHVEGSGATCGDGIKNGDEEGIDCGGSCPDLCGGVGWVQTNGPPGGYINDIAIDPFNPSILYAAGPREGIYKSMDGGNNWELFRFPEPDGAQNIEIDPQNPDILYCDRHNFSKSTDGGISWREANSGFEEVAHLQVFCFEPTNSNILYMAGAKYDGSGLAVFKTEDGARSWRDITGDLVTPPGSEAYALAVLGDGRIFLGVNDRQLQTWHSGKVFSSKNDGQTWSEIDFGQYEDRFTWSILVNPFDLQEVWISEGPLYNDTIDQPLLYRSSDGGTNWEPIRIDVGFDSTQVRVIGASPDGRIYISGGGSLFFTDNGGTSFASVDPPRNEMTFVDFTNIAVHPNNPSILFLPLRAGGIAYSEDGGMNWTLKNNGILSTSINLLAIDPTDPGVVYASSTGGVGTFRSDDYGENWSRLDAGGIVHAWADELTVDPIDTNNVWYVADVPFIHKSADRGDTWQVIGDPYRGGDFNFCSIYAMAQSSDSNVMYTLNNGFGIFKGTRQEHGWDWEFLNLSEIDYTYTIAVHPTNPDIVYSGYIPKPFQDFAMVRRTLDGGDSWETMLEAPKSTGIVSVAIDPSDPDVIYAGSAGKGSEIGRGGQIYKSINGGDSWSELNKHFNMCTVWGQPMLIADPNDPSVAYTATWLAGTWKTTNAGETWTLLEDAPVSSTALSLNRSNSSVIYSADRTEPKVWKSTDAGATWEEIADFSEDRAFLVNRVLVDGNTVYASTFGPSLHGGKLHKSTDAGATWIDITGDLPRSVLDVAVDPANRDTIYVTTHIYGAYKSTDGGTTWMQLPNFPDIGAYDIEVDQVDPTVLYVCGMGDCSVPDWCMEPEGYTFTDGSGVYKSTDSGLTWSGILTTSNECRAVRIHPSNHNLIFAAAMDDGLQVSTDGGNSWTSYNTGLGTQVLTSCAVDSDKIYVGSQGCGVYSGDVNMANWSVRWQPGRSNRPVPQVYSLQIEVDPTNSNRIFVGSNPGGLYRSDDGGATFYDKNFLTPSVVVDDPFRQGYYTFALNPSNTSEVWLGTWGKGIYKSYDGMDFDTIAHGTDMKMYGKHINQIVIDPDLSTVYVAAEEGVFKSSDGGKNWIAINQGLTSTDVRVLHINSNGDLYAGTKGYGLFKWENGYWEPEHPLGNWGVVWPIWDDRPLYQYTSVLIDPKDNNIMYMGTFPAGIYKSTDGGQTWQEKNVGWTNDGVFCLVFHPDNSDIVYAGTYNGINRSLDGGEHWHMWDEGFPPEQWVFSIDFDPEDPDVMYAASKNGTNEGRGEEGFHGTVMKSTNGGEYWFEIIEGLDKNQEFYNIMVDCFDHNRLYLATQREGVFISLDAGGSWTAWNKGLTNLVAGTNGNNVVNTLRLSADGSYLYFGTAGSGVFRRRVTDFPLRVQNLQAIRTGDQITLTWNTFNDMDTDFDHFAIYRSTSPFSNVSGLSPIATITNISAIQYQDTGIPRYTDYYYAVTVTDTNRKENKEVMSVMVLKEPLLWDVDGNGIVDMSDLMLVGNAIGTSGNGTPLDVNSDGKIGILDLILVAMHYRETTGLGAPSAPRSPNSFHIDMLEQWLKVAKTADDGSEMFRRGIVVLESLLNSIVPDHTVLLQNYPNPFNPDTWIPYQLSEASNVSIAIYDVTGRISRSLDLGHRAAGTYRTQATAAHWDGRNETGEPMASGVYFVLLKAGEYQQVRRMVLMR